MMYQLIDKIHYDNDDYIYPEINAIDVNQRDKYFNQDYYNRFMPDDIYFNDLKLYKSLAQDPDPTHFDDYQSWGSPSPWKTFSSPITKKFKELLEQFNLAGCRFYPGDLNFKNKKYPFFVFHCLDGIWFDSIDIDKSIICLWNDLTDKYFLDTEMKIKSLEEFRRIDEELSYKCIDEDMEVEDYRELALAEIHLKEDYDFIRFPKIYDCVSERLKTAIEEAGITGVDFKPIENVKFYYNGEPY